jgi:hypothetical protein
MTNISINKVWDYRHLPFDKNIFYSEKLISPFKNFEEWPKNLQKENPTLLKKEINKDGFRSDNFISHHDGKHFLFAGCSHTWGYGLSIEEVWSKKLYNMLSNEQKCSGFFNLGVTSEGIITQVFNIFKYCSLYGNPTAIFFNIPDLGRFYYYDKDKKNFYNAAYYDDGVIETLNLLSYQYYFMLNQYCLQNNIQLYSFSWVNSKDNNFVANKNKIINIDVLKDFKTFYNIKEKEVLGFVFDYKEKNKNMNFLEVARDGDHLGIAYHEYWSNFIFEKYKLKNKI